MKLKHKVFLVTMLSTILSISLTALFILQANFKILLEEEREQAVVRHNYLISSITSQIIVQKISYTNDFLDQADIQKMIEELSVSQFNLYGIEVSVMYDGDYILGSSQKALEHQQDFLKQLEDTNQIYTSICDEGKQTFLITGCQLKLENESYLLLTTSEITDLFTHYQEHFIVVFGLSLVFALLISLVLYVVIANLLNPLSQLNHSILKIAKGDYSLRLKEKGTEEFVELAHNINTMTLAIEDKTQQLMELADNRQQFINHFAHEMKTPLTSILGFADILRIKKNVSDEERYEYAGIISEEARRLKGLSSKLLELATTNEKALDMELVNIPQLYEEVNQIITPILDRKHIHLIIEAEDLNLMCDKYLVKSMLYNLIDNAYKASYARQMIYLKAYSQNNSIVMEVKDQGVGMNETTLKHVLEPFYMADKARSRQVGGSGLGLALCAQIVEVHHAKLNITSQLNQGTSITITWRKEDDNEA